MAVVTAANTKGKNVTPMSSVLDIKALDVDCSSLANAPIDGEFICVAGHGAAPLQDSNVTLAAADGVIVTTAAKPLAAMTAKMVWSHRDQSDIQATGRKRVPVVWMGGMHVKLGLYNYENASGKGPETGSPVYLCGNIGATPDGAAVKTRLIAHITDSDTAEGFVAKGLVIGVVVAAPATAGGPVEIKLFESPMHLGAL